MTQDTRRCNKCRKDQPEDEDHFSRDKRTRVLSPRCRECCNAQTRRRDQRSRGYDPEMRRGVLATQRAVHVAFRRIDPAGTEENQLRSQLRGIIRRFAGIPLPRKVRAVSWFMQELLQ